MQNLDNILALVRLGLWVGLIVWAILAVYYTVRLQWMRKNGFLYPTLLALFERRRKPARLVDTNTLPSLTAIRQRSEALTTPPPIAHHETQISAGQAQKAGNSDKFGTQIQPELATPSDKFGTQLESTDAFATRDFGTQVRTDTAFDPDKTEKLFIPSAQHKTERMPAAPNEQTDILPTPPSAEATALPQSTPAITSDKMDSRGFHASSPEDADAWNKAWFDSQSWESGLTDKG